MNRSIRLSGPLCRASLLAMGEEGLASNARRVLRTTRAIAEGVRGIPGLELLGDAAAMIVCFRASSSSSLNIYAVGDAMSKRGWALNSLQSPPCIHLCVTALHFGKELLFLGDLSSCVEELRKSLREESRSQSGDASHREGENTKRSSTKKKVEKGQSSVAIYGATASLPPGPINELLKVFNDVVLKM